MNQVQQSMYCNCDWSLQDFHDQNDNKRPGHGGMMMMLENVLISLGLYFSSVDVN